MPDYSSLYDDNNLTQQDIDRIFEVNQKSLSSPTHAVYARSIASINKIATPEASHRESFLSGMSSPDPINRTHTLLDKAISNSYRQAADTANYILQQSQMTSQQKQKIAEDINSEHNNKLKLKDDPFGVEKIEAAAEMPLGTDERQAQLYALRTAQRKDLAHMADKFGVTDELVGLGLSMIPGNYSWNMSQLTGGVPFFGGLTAGNKLSSAVTVFQSLPVERQRNMWPDLKADIIGEFGKTRGLEILSHFASPTGAVEFGDVALWSFLDVADLGLASAGIAKTAFKAATLLNRTSRLGALGADDAVADANVAVLRNPARAEEQGLDVNTAALNADPTDLSTKLDTQAYNGASARTQKRLYAIQKDVKARVKAIIKNSNVQDPFNKSNTNAAAATAAEELRAQYPKIEFTNITTERIGPNEFRTTGRAYDINSKPGPFRDAKGHFRKATDEEKEAAKTVEESFTWNMTLDDNGEYIGTLPKFGTSILNAPKFMLKKDPAALEDLFKSLHNEQVSQQMLNELSETVGEANRLLRGRKARKKKQAVDDLLLQGDVEGKVYDYTYLKDKFTNDQIEYYYAMRQFSDDIGFINDQMLRNRMILQKIKRIKVPAGDTLLESFGKAFDSPQAARSFLGKTDNVARILDARTGKLLNAEDIDWDALYDEGVNLVNLKSKAVYGEQGGRYSTIIVNADNVEELPAQVMHHSTGYVPRIYRKGVYANTLLKKGTIDGAPNQIVDRKTVMLYDNAAEQEGDLGNVIEYYKAQGYDVGLRGEGKEWTVHSTNPNEPSTFVEEAENMGGRLFTSPRASEPIPFGGILNPQTAERLNAVESIERQLGHISANYPRHLHRMAIEDRLQKFAAAYNIDFDLNTPVQGTKEAHRFLEIMRHNYLNWANMRTSDEAWASRRMRSWYEDMVSTGTSRDSLKARAAWSLIYANPAQRIRTANFHVMLGFFNPAQLFVQAQSAVNAASVAPVSRLGNVARGIMGLATAQNVKDLDVGAIAMAKALGVSEDTAKNILKRYHDTGLDKSVFANADIRQVAAGIADPYSVMQKLGKYHTIFYSTGERFNRRSSWIIALERHMDKKAVKARLSNGKAYDELTDEDWTQILNDSNTFMMSMHSANKARWQQGILSLPTQFLQVQAKYIEELLNLENGLTPFERARILLFQVALYGGASLPLIGDEAAEYAGSLIGMSPEESIKSRGLQGGLMSMSMASLGIDSAISQRVAIMGGLEMTWDKLFGEGSTAETLVGPVFTVGGRVWEGLAKFMRTGLGLAGQGVWNPTPYLMSAVENAASVTSSYSNAEKGILLMRTNGAIRDKFGETVDYVNLQTQVAQLLGFRPLASEQVWHLKEHTRALKALKKEGIPLLVDAWKDRMRATTDASRQQANAQIWYILQSHYGNPVERQEALSKVWNNMNSGQTELAREFQRWRQTMQEEAADTFSPYYTDE